tara:strand:- start:5578 stop:6417 length:840 start_codon:yes stop_codon:yes gene_type:complete
MSNAKSGTTLTGWISLFIGITTIFFGFKGWKLSNMSPNDVTSGRWMTPAYLLLILIIQFCVNIGLASGFCKGGSQNIFSVFMYTILPNFLILGSVIALISALPGWLSPFSNTFGFLLVSCMGLSKNFNNMLRSDKGSSELLTRICSDESLIINEMTPDNYTDFMETLSSGKEPIIIKKPTVKSRSGQSKAKEMLAVENYNKMYQKIYSLVVLKNIIAEWIWYVLAGCLALTISIKSISNIECEYSTEEMTKTVNDMHDQQAAAEDEEARKNKASQYTVT